MKVTPEELRDKFGFKFAIGEMLQLKGRADPNETTSMRLRGDAVMMRVVCVKLLIGSDGMECLYYIRGIHPSGDWVTRPGSALGVYEFTEDELEPFVDKVSQETPDDK